MAFTFDIINQTTNTLSYLGGLITVPANGTATVPNMYVFNASIDGQIKSDALNGIILISDGVSKYASNDAITFLLTIFTNNGPGLGQQPKANSRPVVIASDQDPIPVSIQTTSSGTPISNYNGVSSVAMGVLTNILTYTVPTGKTFYLNRIEVSGTNIGTYTVLFNSATNAKKYTYYGNLNELFDYTMGGNENGFPLVTGTTVTVTTIHMIQSPGDFNARLQGYEV